MSIRSYKCNLILYLKRMKYDSVKIEGGMNSNSEVYVIFLLFFNLIYFSRNYIQEQILAHFSRKKKKVR
jgi:hypothetical protein